MKRPLRTRPLVRDRLVHAATHEVLEASEPLELTTMERQAEGAADATSRIRWHTNRETRYPFGERPADPEWFEPLGFPPPWPDRPWIYGVVVASANGVLAWRRADASDDPVLAVLGGDRSRAERVADSRHLRHLRCFGDVGLGAQTLRDQPRLVPTPQELGDDPVPALYRFRERRGLPHHPRTILYSLRGRLDLTLPVFNTPGLDVIVVGTADAAATLAARGGVAAGVEVIAESLLEPAGLRRAHERLFADRGVRYLACEGGEKILRALRAAGLLDEVFVTVTDQTIDESAHGGIVKVFDFESEGADLIAEGRTTPASAWIFRRWRFNAR
jgi:riboflavin biosynthesis pyrimidine reductase